MVRFIHSRAMLGTFPALYRAVRKSTWGGLMPMYMENRDSKSMKMTVPSKKTIKKIEESKKESVRTGTRRRSASIFKRKVV
jgi:hypothetical protein